MKALTRWRATFVSVATIVAVFASILAAMSAPGQRFLAPGPLRGSHGAKNLACGACHDALLGVPDRKCERCHKDIARNRGQRSGSHAGMIGACMGCHPSHIRFAEPDTRIDPSRVDHSLTRFSLKAHDRQACADCHGDRFAKFGRTERRRCIACHLELKVVSPGFFSQVGVAWAGSADSSRAKAFDRHQRAVGEICLKCHKGDSRIAYSHKKAGDFFVAKHASSACSGCHKNERYALDRGACETCHRQGHGPALAAGCVRCHNLKGWRPAEPDHTGKLGGDHLKLACVKCHKTDDYAGLAWECIKCHQDRHNGSVSPDCRRCHDESRWKPAKMDHAAVTEACTGCHQSPNAHFPGSCGRCHSFRAWKPAKAPHSVGLGGVHPGLSCAACHRGQRFSGLSWACAGCHRGSHSSGYGSNCAGCHNQSTWKGATFKHNGISGDCSACHRAPGGHYSGSCSQCHKTPGSWASTLGSHPRVGEHSSTSFPCSYCHPSGYGSSDCTRCHKNGAPDD